MTMFDETLNASQPLRFDSTQWSLVIQAQQRSSPEGRIAFSQLCERYWFPLYAHVRSRGVSVDDAQDLTQGFFQRVIEKDYISDADPNRGRFRTFLLTSLSNYLANESDKRNAAKRGGSKLPLSLEFTNAERRFSIEMEASESPAQNWNRQWARSLLDRVISVLHSEYRDAKKDELFSELKQFLVDVAPEPSKDIAVRLGMSPAAVRVAVHRLRSQYRAKLLSEIAATVADPAEVEEEVALLFQSFAR
ncbi:MAG: sigma-70 family RNA polymerase sigma factor [Planctomycetota bacterium]